MLSAVIPCAAFVFDSVAFAQQAATGVVEGRVQNAASGNYLNNARVRVAGTTIETFTNPFGEVRLTVEPARSTLEIFFTGLAGQRLAVTVCVAERAAGCFAARCERERG